MRRSQHLWRERGSATLEVAIVTPVMIMLLAAIVIGGRIALARQAVESVAFDAARAASLATSPGEASSLAHNAANYSLASNGLKCSSRNVSLNLAGLSASAGSSAHVSASVSCTVALADVAFPGMPSSVTLRASSQSPVDTYRDN